MSDLPTTLTAAPPGRSAGAAAYYTAGPWRMMWWKFRRHRVAKASLAVLAVLYFCAAFCEFVAPRSLEDRDPTHLLAPPQRVHLFDADGPHRPFVYALRSGYDPQTRRKHYSEDTSRRYPIRLLVRGDSYRLWGLFETDVHLLGIDPADARQDGSAQAAGAPALCLLGTDWLGRDVLSRVLYGARISLTIGLVGVAISFVLGLSIGALSGYAGGWVDNIIQRLIEVLRSFPAIPLWMGLAAALPESWTPLQVYMGITVVLSFIGWTGLARQVRGKILALREEDYATAAVLAGASRWRVMWRHLLPGFASHIIVVLTLAVPGMILGETSLSFLGLGLRPPVVSWGVMLKDAQNVQVVAMHPWLLTPAILVILTVLALNFVGDGMRDAADPYSR